MRSLKRLVWRDDAATAVEYCIMLGMILLVIIGAVGTVGTQAAGLWSGIFTSLTNVVFGH